jgi:thioredoxin-dependent peroxiredoxin
MIGAGDKAPPFALADQDGNEVTLDHFEGKRLVLYFYPKALTPGCTTQACGVREHRLDYHKAGAVVVGVSPDEPERLRKFADKHELEFTLLSDPRHEVAKAYGVWVEKSLYGRKFWGNERTTFVIGEDGKIATVLRRVKPKAHDSMVLKALAES